VVQINIPDIGTQDAVDIIEVHMKPGQAIKLNDPLVTLEGDKATMDVPAAQSGTIDTVLVKVGDKVQMGAPIATLTTTEPSKTPTPAQTEPSAPSVPSEHVIKLPDLGTTDAVDVIEVAVKIGDKVQENSTVLTLEGDKATMDIPASLSGEVVAIQVKVGDKVTTGTAVLTLLATTIPTPAPPTAQPAAHPTAHSTPVASAPQATGAPVNDNRAVYASPIVRRIAREFGINLTQVTGSGRKGRILKVDCQNYVKARLGDPQPGINIAASPAVDFSKYGDIETAPLSKLKRVSGETLHKNWLSIPHVTHFDSADITTLEVWRQAHKAQVQQSNCKLTPLVLIMKAVVAALQEFPQFNASLDPSAKHLIMKKYFHLGVAVETERGLVVPVIRDVDKKSVLELAQELAHISHKARDTGLSIQDMEGSCFTISSLGGIGGVGFTPIIKAPDVAILGVSKARHEAVYLDAQFVPRLVLPFSLSYDHRVIDGAQAARFCRYLADYLQDDQHLSL
jgi:pyruvate dehydrogenase E2 component (dihydrolipoyllysine-residue acetyltransferase)